MYPIGEADGYQVNIPELFIFFLRGDISGYKRYLITCITKAKFEILANPCFIRTSLVMLIFILRNEMMRLLLYSGIKKSLYDL